MAERILNLGPNHRIRIDDTNNLAYLEFYDSGTATWKVALKLKTPEPTTFEIPVPLIFETAKTGLAADSTGVKFDSEVIIPNSDLLRYCEGVAIEATWTASDADSVTKIGIYNATAGAYVCSVSGNTGTDQRSALGTLTAGHKIKCRVEVTTASGTAGATTDVTKAVAYFKINFAM